MSKRAFTLIELLVVIAIIAILAAILFPVFAQAKDAAKDTADLSNVKQMALSVLMYGNDADDGFPLTARSDSSGWDTWLGMVQPYTKSPDVQLCVKIPHPSGPRAYWQQLQHWGAMPRAVSVNGPNSYFSWSQGTLTGGQTVKFDGAFGAGIAPGSGWYGQVNASSLTQSNIADVSNYMMICEANNWDLWWGIYGQGYQMGWCQNWGSPWSQPGNSDIFGPHARKASKNPQSGCIYPNGLTIYAAADGSAKAKDYRGVILGRKQLSDGTWVHPVMWPGPIN